MDKKLFYYMSLFLYSLRYKENITKNAVFRYIYIFTVASSYLNNDDENIILDELTIDSEIGIVNASQMEDTLAMLNSQNYILLEGFKINICEKLKNYCNKRQKESEKFNNDLKAISYFVNLISSYSDEIVLSVFFNEPNIEEALSRNKTEISLNDNQLYNLLVKFQNNAKSAGVILENYDAFISWLDFVFEEYLEGKKMNG
ncbi:hypothetical protein H8787_03495 [Streptococcus sp. NSJ-72]|uniref:Uncharacterized protein n=1 Tax=Streptococcus intermedius TaxID=1338 RepID=A0AAD1C6U1_STRIT|nr:MULTISPECIES: hypothetical protein [Streptococcus]QNL42923.1 hypothetical protein H8787_03495 [Streptococcus sp. NSJ-72]RSJ20757.1 hypothetical protein D8829_00690 [Streptococcus intermedius]BAW16475.1 hypothetical protein SITYG_04890 [Streptococcus intermedius]